VVRGFLHSPILIDFLLANFPHLQALQVAPQKTGSGGLVADGLKMTERPAATLGRLSRHHGHFASMLFEAVD